MKIFITFFVLVLTLSSISFGDDTYGTYTLNQTNTDNVTLDPGFTGIGTFTTFQRNNLFTSWSSFNGIQYLETYPWTTSSSIDTSQNCKFWVKLNAPYNFNGISLTLELKHQIWYINSSQHGPTSAEITYRFGTTGNFNSAGTWSPSQNSWGTSQFSIPANNSNHNLLEIRIHGWNSAGPQYVYDRLFLRDVILSGSSFPLPVELSSFSANLRNNHVVLNWSTMSETDNYGFEIQRASTNNIWEKIGFVNGSGNSNSPKNYSFIDKTVNSGKYTYRLKQVDANGSYTYSKIVEIDLGIPAFFVLEQNYPNPFNPSTVITYQVPVQSIVEISVFNSIGEKVAELVNEVKEAGYYEVEFNAASLS